MRIDFDNEVRAWYLTLSDSAVERTVHVSDEVAVDLDGSGAVVGVEFLVPPAEPETAVVRSLSERFPDVGLPLTHQQSLSIADQEGTRVEAWNEGRMNSYLRRRSEAPG